MLTRVLLIAFLTYLFLSVACMVAVEVLADDTPAPAATPRYTSPFCELADPWGNTSWRPCTDAKVWDI